MLTIKYHVRHVLFASSRRTIVLREPYSLSMVSRKATMTKIFLKATFEYLQKAMQRRGQVSRQSLFYKC